MENITSKKSCRWKEKMPERFRPLRKCRTVGSVAAGENSTAIGMAAGWNQPWEAACP